MVDDVGVSRRDGRGGLAVGLAVGCALRHGENDALNCEQTRALIIVLPEQSPALFDGCAAEAPWQPRASRPHIFGS